MPAPRMSPEQRRKILAERQARYEAAALITKTAPAKQSITVRAGASRGVEGDSVMKKDTPLIPGYAEIRLNGKRRFIKITHENAMRILGRRVNRDGAAWEAANKDGVTQELIICAPGDVIRRMVLNTFYCELEEEVQPIVHLMDEAHGNGPWCETRELLDDSDITLHRPDVTCANCLNGIKRRD